MKKLLSLILALALVMCLCACGAPSRDDDDDDDDDDDRRGGFGSMEIVEDTEPLENEAGLTTGELPTAAPAQRPISVGFGRANITPDASVPMAGYPFPDQRMSTGIMDYSYASCVVMVERGKDPVLLISLDLYEVPAGLSDAVSQSTNVPEENILIHATGVFASPDVSSQTSASYKKRLQQWVCEAASYALADAAPAEVSVSAIAAYDYAFCSRYYMNDGSVSSRFGGSSDSGYLSHIAYAPSDLSLIRFTRAGKDDLILANFAARPAFTTEATNCNLSADYIGSFRNQLSQNTGANVIFFGATAADVECVSLIREENVYANFRDYGKALGDTASRADYTTLDSTTSVTLASRTLSMRVNHSQDHLLAVAMPVLNAWKTGSSYADCVAMGEAAGVYSPFLAQAISNNGMLSATQDVEVTVISLGDIAFVAVPGQLFGTDIQALTDGLPYTTTFVLGNTNGSFGPLAPSGQDGGFEVDGSRFTPESVDSLVESCLDLLSQLY